MARKFENLRLVDTAVKMAQEFRAAAEKAAEARKNITAIHSDPDFSDDYKSRQSYDVASNYISFAKTKQAVIDGMIAQMHDMQDDSNIFNTEITQFMIALNGCKDFSLEADNWEVFHNLETAAADMFAGSESCISLAESALKAKAWQPRKLSRMHYKLPERCTALKECANAITDDPVSAGCVSAYAKAAILLQELVKAAGSDAVIDAGASDTMLDNYKEAQARAVMGL